MLQSQSRFSMHLIEPYRMHVSQSYLDLTRQKLELTRTPHQPKHRSTECTTSQRSLDMESLLDCWLRNYNWRERESYYNEHLPQYRIYIGGSWVHFVHKQSAASDAIPLLLLHSFPESFLTADRMVDNLTDPDQAHLCRDHKRRAFHVVVPSVPGTGFSDMVVEEKNNIQASAELIHELMKDLGYRRFMLHGSAW